MAVVYLVGANLFLGTGWFARVVNAYPETLDVHYGKGWTLWPGRLHAKDLSIRATDSNVEWILRIDDVTFDVSLWGLLHRRFFADHVHGTGVSLRIRQRLDAMPRTQAEVADLPSVEGLPPYGLRPKVRDPFPVWDDACWDLWTIRLRDVVAEHTREVWIDSTRFSGDARVTGGFYLKPLREAQIGPAHVDVAEGRVGRGESEMIATTVGGSLDVTVDAFDPRVTSGKAVLERVSARLLASSQLHAPVPAVVTARVGLTRGRIEDGSRLLGFAPHVEQRVGDMVARGSVEANADARGDELDVQAESWRARLERDRRFVAEGDLALAARVRGLDLGRHRDDLDVSGSRLVVTRATLTEHGHVEDGWGAELAVDHAHLHIRPPRFEGRVRVGASDALPLFSTALHDQAPRIVESLLTMPRLQGMASVIATPDSLVVDDLVARGGDVGIRGAYARIEADPLGAFVIDKGPFSAGIAIDGQGAHPRIFGLDGWLAEQEATINRWLEERTPPAAARERAARGPRSGL